jgi:hypothetical protein
VSLDVAGVPYGVVRFLSDEGRVLQTLLPASGSGTVTYRTTPSLAAFVRAAVRDLNADGTPGNGAAMGPDLRRKSANCARFTRRACPIAPGRCQGSRVPGSACPSCLHVGAVLRSTDEQLLTRVNLDSTVSLAGAAVASGVRRFVFTSTNLVYPGGLGGPATEADEAPPELVWGTYPRVKAETERALLAVADLGVRIVGLAFRLRRGRPAPARVVAMGGALAGAPRCSSRRSQWWCAGGTPAAWPGSTTTN